MSSRPEVDVLIVGGGLGGFVAAIEAADRGARVMVLEARRSLGGRARSSSEAGFLLNEGAHALYRSGPAWHFLTEHGVEPSGGLPDARAGVGVDADCVGPLPSGPASLLRSPHIAGDRLRFAKFFAGLDRLDVDGAAEETVADAVRRIFGEGRAGRLGLALLRLATYGNDPEIASAGPALAQLRDAVNTPVLYVDGGWQSIVDSLVMAAPKRQVEIRAGTKVASVEELGDHVHVRSTDGEITASAVVVAAGGPAGLASMLRYPPAEVTRWASEARPCTVASFDVGLAEPWGPFPTFALGIDRPLYLSVHAPIAALAPTDGSLVHVMRYHHPEEPLDAEADRVDCEELLDRIRPGWREAAVHVGFRRRLTAAFDQPRAARGGLAGRPGPSVPGHRRVFVAGDWVGPEGLLADAATASGRSAAAAAAQVGELVG